MNEQVEEITTTTEAKKEKKQRKESLLVKYGVVAFLEILAFISVFLIYITTNLKAPIQSIYDESVDNFIDSAIDNVQT